MKQMIFLRKKGISYKKLYQSNKPGKTFFKLGSLMKNVLLAGIVILTLAVLGCAREEAMIKLVSPEEFKTLIADDDVFVLDVHIPEQRHIEGTDAFVQYDKLLENADKLPKDKDTKIAVYCRSGTMSAEAARTLQEMGYTQIYDLNGGRNAYVALFGDQIK